MTPPHGELRNPKLLPMATKKSRRLSAYAIISSCYSRDSITSINGQLLSLDLSLDLWIPSPLIFPKFSPTIVLQIRLCLFIEWVSLAYKHALVHSPNWNSWMQQKKNLSSPIITNYTLFIQLLIMAKILELFIPPLLAL